MKLFDAHCHLQPTYAPDAKEVLLRMQEKQMGAVVIGTDYDTSAAAVALAQQYDFLWASVGLHPNDEGVFDFEKFEALGRDEKVVAVGECGLDYFRSAKTDGQKDRFLQHIDLAEKLGKPLIIHCRDSQQRIANTTSAHDDMLAILAERKPGVDVIMHFFTGSGELAQKYLDLGCYLSFPGPITYTDMYDDSIRLCPLDKMLIETDSPFAAPVPHRGKRNEPGFVEHVAAKIAVSKGLSVEEVAADTVRNARTVFKLG